MKSTQQKRTEALARRQRDAERHKESNTKKRAHAVRDVANLRRKLGMEPAS